MATFVKFKVSGEEKFIYVNPETISYIRVAKDNTTVIVFCVSDKDGFCVKLTKESMQSVIEKLERANCKIID